MARRITAASLSFSLPITVSIQNMPGGYGEKKSHEGYS